MSFHLVFIYVFIYLFIYLFYLFSQLFQEIIKVRERIPYKGPLTKVIRLKLFLDIVPSSFANITRALRGCFRGGSVYVSFRFKAKQNLQLCGDVFFDILITSKGASTLGML